MRRFMIVVVAALALLAAGCGSSTEEQFRDSLIDGGFTEEQADCVISELDAAGIDPESITDEALGDEDPPPEAVQATVGCLLSEEDSGLLDLLDEDGVVQDGPQNYGDDPELDALWDACSSGDGVACDDLYFGSPIGSGYEAYGDTCGERFQESVLSCEDELG